MQRALPILWFLSLVVASGPRLGAQQLPPNPPARAAAPPKTALVSIREHRGGGASPVLAAAEVLTLDLASVDFDADPLLLFGGEPVTQAEFQRSVCLLAGSNEIEQATTAALVRHLKREMQAAGRDLGHVQVTEEEVLGKFEEQKRLIPQTTGMSAEDWEKQIREQFGWDRFLEFQSVQLEFEKLLLPDPPPGFLEEQARRYEEAQSAWEAEQDRRAREAEARGEEPPEPGAPPVPDADLSFLPEQTMGVLDEAFGRLLRQTYSRGQELPALIRDAASRTIRGELLKSVGVDFSPDATGPELLRVGDESVLVSDLYPLVRGHLQPGVLALALQEIVLLRALDRALGKEGFLLDPAAAQQAFQAERDRFEGTLIPLATAIQLRGFFNIYHYQRYFRRKESFRRLLAARIEEEELRDHFERCGRLFFEQGAVDGTLLFLPGADREATGVRMAQALGQARSSSFEEVARELGQYPPSSDVTFGRVRMLVRNRLRQVLGESEYLTFLTGYSMADDVFYRAEEGEIVGPIYRDLSPRLTGSLAFKVGAFYSTGRHGDYGAVRERALEDLADLRFPRFANESLAACRIERPPR